MMKWSFLAAAASASLSFFSSPADATSLHLSLNSVSEVSQKIQTDFERVQFTECLTHLIDPATKLSFHSMSISPNFNESPELISKEDELKVDFKAHAVRKLDDLKVGLSYSVYDVEVFSKSFDICHEEVGFGVKCPIEEGDDFEGSLSYNLPKEVPRGIPVQARLVLEDGNGPIGCMEGEFEVFESVVGANLNLMRNRFGFSDAEVDYLFDAWKKQYSELIQIPKDQGDGIMLAVHDRKEIFRDNLMKIAAHNAQKQDWKMGMNQFAHLTSEEFKRIYASGLKMTKSKQDKPLKGLRAVPNNRESGAIFRFARSLQSILFDVQSNIPKEVNWVQKGAVTPVKNQGACGSCWSFATTGAMEGAYFIKNHKLVSFSEQELVACDHVDLGCNGGAMDNAYTWIEQSQGLCTEDDYPYTSAEGVRGFCKQTSCTPVPDSAPKSFVDVEHHDISLEEAVANQPVAVAIEADEEAFQFYSSGVLTAACSQKLDHGVLVVGYGEEAGSKYWLVKNSWGPQWGLEGYIKIERGTEEYEGGECGILLSPSYPVF